MRLIIKAWSSQKCFIFLFPRCAPSQRGSFFIQKRDSRAMGDLSSLWEQPKIKSAWRISARQAAGFNGNFALKKQIWRSGFLGVWWRKVKHKLVFAVHNSPPQPHLMKSVTPGKDLWDLSLGGFGIVTGSETGGSLMCLARWAWLFSELTASLSSHLCSGLSLCQWNAQHWGHGWDYWAKTSSSAQCWGVPFNLSQCTVLAQSPGNSEPGFSQKF